MKNARPPTLAQASRLAPPMLSAVLRKAASLPGLKRRSRAPGPWHVELRLVGSAPMKRLNARYRGKDYATDVLSFPAPEVFRGQGWLGELVICWPVAVRQARELGHPSEAELQVLIVHGVLHLLGLDHELGLAEAREMARWERRLLPVRLRGLVERAGSGGLPLKVDPRSETG